MEQNNWQKKLTTAQIDALKAVAAGKVSRYDPLDMRKPIRISGAHKGVIDRLIRMQLIQCINTDSSIRKTFVLTSRGRTVLTGVQIEFSRSLK